MSKPRPEVCITHGSEMLFCADCVQEYIARLLDRVYKRAEALSAHRGDTLVVTLNDIASIINKERHE
jgi:hypothetical protein